jgi:hypothetical protein
MLTGPITTPAESIEPSLYDVVPIPYDTAALRETVAALV